MSFSQNSTSLSYSLDFVDIVAIASLAMWKYLPKIFLASLATLILGVSVASAGHQVEHATESSGWESSCSLCAIPHSFKTVVTAGGMDVPQVQVVSIPDVPALRAPARQAQHIKLSAHQGRAPPHVL